MDLRAAWGNPPPYMTWTTSSCWPLHSHNNLLLVQQLCDQFGIPLALEKVKRPAHCLTFLGIALDTSTMEARLPVDKLSASAHQYNNSFRGKKPLNAKYCLWWTYFNTPQRLSSQAGHLSPECMPLLPKWSYCPSTPDLTKDFIQICFSGICLSKDGTELVSSTVPPVWLLHTNGCFWFMGLWRVFQWKMASASLVSWMVSYRQNS